jgi:hypothetical protein
VVVAATENGGAANLLLATMCPPKLEVDLYPEKTRRLELGRFAEQNRKRRGLTQCSGPVLIAEKVRLTISVIME